MGLAFLAQVSPHQVWEMALLDIARDAIPYLHGSLCELLDTRSLGRFVGTAYQHIREGYLVLEVRLRLHIDYMRREEQWRRDAVAEFCLAHESHRNAWATEMDYLQAESYRITNELRQLRMTLRVTQERAILGHIYWVAPAYPATRF